MSNIEIAQMIAGYHNLLSEISVRGEDVLRMRDVLVSMRNTASQLTQESGEPQAEAEGE